MFSADLAGACLQEPHKLHPPGRRGIAPISESVNVNALDIVHVCQAQESFQMRFVGVNTAISQQAENMQLRRMFLDMLDGFQEGWVLIERAIANRFADAGIVLQDALPRADILVPHFRVAHLPFW